MANKRTIGFQKEQLAAEYLISQGVTILEKNFYFRGGEIDLIGIDGEYLCFIEVKYRTSNQYGLPEDAITWNKQKKMMFGAKQYLYQQKRSLEISCRFDTVCIYGETITWIRNAFDFL